MIKINLIIKINKMQRKKKTLLLLVLITSLNFYSQISFEKGYYISNSNQKIECLVKNYDWVYNPTEIEYKLAENKETRTTSIDAIKEFGIYNISKYIKATVNIDISSDNVNKLNTDKNPVFQEKKIFLKVLIEGKSNLYEYSENNLNRFFYGKESLKIEQLIFKSYKINDVRIAKNNYYRQQLWKDLKCSSFNINKVQNLNYTKKSLLFFFKEYSDCNNYETTNYLKTTKKDLFNFNIRPRINNSSFVLLNSGTNRPNVDFGSKTTFALGFEAEFFLPFNKNKWSIIIEPTFQGFKSETTNDVSTVSGGKLNSNINYKSVEIPVGVRHHFFIDKSSSIFVNASLIYDINSKSTIEMTRKDGTHKESLDIQSKTNYALGLGYRYNSRYSIEMRYQTARNLLGTINWGSEYKTVSVIFGYTLF